MFAIKFAFDISHLKRGNGSLVDTNEIMTNVNALVTGSGMTTADIAQRLGEPEQKIKRTLEGKNPSFVSLCAIITACGGSVDEMIGNTITGTHPGNDPLVVELRSVAHYERRRARVWSTLFVVFAFAVMAVLVYDAFNPHIGWIRYATQSGTSFAETAGRVLRGAVDWVTGHAV